MGKEELTSNYKVAIADTSTLISQECFQQRSAVIITNTSTAGQVIYIAVGQEAKVGEGIPLSVGGVYQDTMDAGYKPSNKQIQAISSAVGGLVSVHERIIVNTY